ncbi:hypothetical protein BU16DRAFT_531235 [Lophium mytilinum]|uniref:2EXR domain-containing protein n=1 Tax=Lophium mytilinum TaxID=390894 RepID=A0A6A6QE45_9PEZI|nr:hypothetical protein BU16DRAFT_531235 [Lophium mytilinum]
MEIDVAATDPKLPSKPFPFFALPAELRNEIYAHHAATENTVTVAMRRSRVSEDWHAGYKPLLPKPPALLQVCQQARTEYFPIWVSQTEFTLGLASDSSIEVVKMWLEWIRPFAGYLNQMSFILRGEKWTEGRSDLPPHGWIEMVYDGWVEYWFDFRKGVADGDLIYVDGERLEYSAPADRSEMIGKEREAFGVTVEEMRKKRQAGKLVVGDVKKLINALVRDHGHLVETRVLRRRFGPW